MYHNCCIKGAGSKGDQNVRYWPFTKLFHNMADFWTDILFACILYYENTCLNLEFGRLLSFEFPLSYVAMLFTFAPFVLSCVIGLKFIIKWKHHKQDHAIRLRNYFDRYESLVCLLTIVSNFYATIDVCQCKLFYKNMFNLPLRKCEYNQLRHFKFINIVLFENLPQFLIQILYLVTTDVSDQSIMVYFSFMFTAVALLFAFESELLHVCQLCCKNGKNGKYNGAFTYENKFDCKMTLSCSKFQYRHSFGKMNVNKAILSVLNTSDDNNLWLERSDVRLEIETYYVDERIHTLQEMDCYFEILLLTMGKPDKQLITKMKQNLLEMENTSKHNNVKFIKVK